MWIEWTKNNFFLCINVELNEGDVEFNTELIELNEGNVALNAGDVELNAVARQCLFIHGAWAHQLHVLLELRMTNSEPASNQP